MSFKIEFTEKLPEGMESGVADFHNLSMGVNLVKIDDKTLWGEALPCEYIFFIMIFKLQFDAPRKVDRSGIKIPRSGILCTFLYLKCETQELFLSIKQSILKS